MQHIIISKSREETFQIGKKLGQKLQGGEVICLYGELGVGKTVFAKGIGKGLGIHEEITSPTFTLIQDYILDTEQELRFVHMDLYRLNHPEEAEVIGVTEFFRDDCICLLEWPQLIEDALPEDRLDVRIEGSGDLPRSITFTAYAATEMQDNIKVLTGEEYEISNN